MKGIKDRVAVIGMGCTRFGELWDKSQEDLMIESCHEAFEDAGIEPKAIDAAWLGTVYGGLLGSRLARSIKLGFVPITRVENLCCTGSDAFRNACYAVAAGVCDIALACGVEKLKDTGYEGALVDTTDSDHRSRMEVLVPPPTYFALRAVRYFETYGLDPEEGKEVLGKIAVKNHFHGALSPKAQYQREMSLEQVVKAPMIASPLGVFDCCGISDGSAAAVITTPEIAKTYRDDYILVKGLSMVNNSAEPVLRDDYDFVHFDEIRIAAQMAYKEAGIKDPRKEIDMAIVHDCFTITELLIYEDLGFSPDGKAKEDVNAGAFQLGGELPVNTDGGLKCFGHPLGATGLRMIYEVYKQLQGKADKRQVKDADIGLAHNLAGNPDCYLSTVSILGRRD